MTDPVTRRRPPESGAGGPESSPPAPRLLRLTRLAVVFPLLQGLACRPSASIARGLCGSRDGGKLMRTRLRAGRPGPGDSGRRWLRSCRPWSGAGLRRRGRPNTLTPWHYEGPDSAMGIAWAEAIRLFEDSHPGVTVRFEEEGFEQIRKTAPNGAQLLRRARPRGTPPPACCPGRACSPT